MEGSLLIGVGGKKMVSDARYCSTLITAKEGQISVNCNDQWSPGNTLRITTHSSKEDGLTNILSYQKYYSKFYMRSLFTRVMFCSTKGPILFAISNRLSDLAAKFFVISWRLSYLSKLNYYLHAVKDTEIGNF